MAEPPQAEIHTAEAREPAMRKADDRKSETRNTRPSDQMNGETAGVVDAADGAARAKH